MGLFASTLGGDGDEKMFPFRPQRDCYKPRRKKTQTFETKVLAVGGLATIISKMVNLLDDDKPSLTKKTSETPKTPTY